MDSAKRYISASTVLPVDGRASWFVARTRFFRQEIQMRDELTRRGIDNFVPTVRMRRGTGKGTFEKAVAPNIVFVRGSKTEVCSLVSNDHLPIQLMQDCATKHLMVVPDKQMEDFRRVFDFSITQGGLVDEPLSPNDSVRVTKGALKGVEGYVAELPGKTYVVVGLLGCIWARARVPRAWLEKRV